MSVPTLDIYMTPDRGAVRVEDLTREEAIAALKDMFRELNSSRESTRRAFDLVGMYQRSRAR